MFCRTGRFKCPSGRRLGFIPLARVSQYSGPYSSALEQYSAAVCLIATLGSVRCAGLACVASAGQLRSRAWDASAVSCCHYNFLMRCIEEAQQRLPNNPDSLRTSIWRSQGRLKQFSGAFAFCDFPLCTTFHGLSLGHRRPCCTLIHSFSCCTVHVMSSSTQLPQEHQSTGILSLPVRRQACLMA